VKFLYNQTIEKLVVDAGAIKGVMVNGELLTADQYVLALGSYSRALLQPLQLNLPVYPVKGYSLTVPIINADLAPQST
ncbi:FAD-dependent oxidoreductase, partial [Pseudomonas aeruginosa]